MKLRTGNVILAAGQQPAGRLICASNRIAGAKGQAAKITHGGVMYIYRLEPYIIETTSISWNGKKGFQINNYHEWLEHYKGPAWVREIDHRLDESVVARFIQKHKLDKYENGFSGAMALLAAGMGGHHESLMKIWEFMGWQTTTPHCTELVALLFNYCDRSGFDVHHMPPYKLWDGGEFDQGLYGTKLGKAEQVKE